MDRAEMALFPHTDKPDDLARNRAELDANLLASSGRQASADKALLRELGGGTT